MLPCLLTRDQTSRAQRLWETNACCISVKIMIILLIIMIMMTMMTMISEQIGLKEWEILPLMHMLGVAGPVVDKCTIVPHKYNQKFGLQFNIGDLSL